MARKTPKLDAEELIKTERIGITIRENLLALVNQRAAAADLTRSTFITRILEDFERVVNTTIGLRPDEKLLMSKIRQRGYYLVEKDLWAIASQLNIKGLIYMSRADDAGLKRLTLKQGVDYD